MPTGIYVRTAYHRRRLRESNTKYWLGKKRGTQDKEWRQKISNSMKGKNTWMLGKRHTRTTILKMRKIHHRDNILDESRIKMSKIKKGSKTHLWKGGVTSEEHTIRNNVHYKIWRDKVFKRDKRTCQICFIKRKILHAHHIKSFKNYPALRFTVDNGLTVCRKCHEKIHARNKSRND